MKKITLLSAFLAVSVLVGCYVPSLHPLYTKQDLLFNPELVGKWNESEKDKTQWVFEKKGEKSYKLQIIQEDKKPFVFTACLLKVGACHYLDLFPDTDDSSNEDFLTKGMLPTHIFVRLRQLAPTLDVEVMNAEWIRIFLNDHPEAVKHEKMLVGEKDDPLIVLTAQPKELQAFLLKHEKTEKVWNKLNSLKKP